MPKNCRQATQYRTDVGNLRSLAPCQAQYTGRRTKVTPECPDYGEYGNTNENHGFVFLCSRDVELGLRKGGQVVDVHVGVLEALARRKVEVPGHLRVNIAR